MGVLPAFTATESDTPSEPAVAARRRWRGGTTTAPVARSVMATTATEKPEAAGPRAARTLTATDARKPGCAATAEGVSVAAPEPEGTILMLKVMRTSGTLVGDGVDVWDDVTEAVADELGVALSEEWHRQ